MQTFQHIDLRPSSHGLPCRSDFKALLRSEGVSLSLKSVSHLFLNLKLAEISLTEAQILTLTLLQFSSHHNLTTAAQDGDLGAIENVEGR